MSAQESLNGNSCAICQPHYIPWIGYFEMISRVDMFVFLDDVQFIKREWKNRNRIRKTPGANEPKWLSVPIKRECQHDLISRANISNDRDWASGHLSSLKHTYLKTRFFHEYFDDIKGILAAERFGSLAELNISLVRYFCNLLGIRTKLIRSSSLTVGGRREERLLNICKVLRATAYLANNATAAYVGAEYFASHNIGFMVQDYEHPIYEQAYEGKTLPFLSHLSIVDLLFNHGPRSLDILTN
jgi:hypothetical protein